VTCDRHCSLLLTISMVLAKKVQIKQN